MSNTRPSRPNGWHFTQRDCRLGYGDGRMVRPGKALRMKGRGKPKLCKRGMHASKLPLDALDAAAIVQDKPVVAWRVRVCGDVDTGAKKFCGRWREAAYGVDAEQAMHRFAVWCARRALRIAKVKDRRCHEALRVKLAWLDGKATDDELAAARDAAWAAARDAAWAAARVAAWVAAGDAAGAAAGAAAGVAAGDAARAAAGDAAGDAARAAAWDTERKLQNRKLAEMLRMAPRVK